MENAGKTLLVLGAAGGIGAAIVERYWAGGGNVMAADLRAMPARPRLVACVCNAADEHSVDDAVEQTMAAFGRIDAVVHAVGIPGQGPLAALDLASWQRVMDVNLTSAFLLARAVHPHLRASRGGLVFIASTSGRNGGTPQTGPAYAASKAGMINLARYLAKEWATDGIRVNSIAPGPVRTPLMDAAGPERQAAYASAMLTKRLTDPDELAAATLFLLSDQARSMTGSILNVSGGLVLD